MASSPCIIKNTSEYTLQLMQTCTSGTVHSIYRKTINLSFDGQLLALQACGSPLSPISLITELDAEYMECLPITVGDPATVKNGVLSLNDRCIFSWNTARVHNLTLSERISKAQLPYLMSCLRDALSLRDAGSFDLLFTNPTRADDLLVLNAAGKRLLEAKLYLQNHQWNEAADMLCRLVGLGLGLTPAGDDFLCGVLAGLIFCGLDSHPFYQALSFQVQEHLTNTNDISATFLRCALQGQFSLAVKRLPSLTSASEIFSVFREIGHSSGTDTLCGIYYVLSIFPSLI